jgi:hypothetical protein
MRTTRLIGIVLALGVLAGGVPAGRAADSSDPQQTQFDQTPPRLSYADGKVSFWREGADDWSTAQVNTALAPGDELYTDSPANLEIQIGARAFARAWANTQLGLVNQDAGFLQFKVTEGVAAFDMRTVEPGTTVEVDTPNAAFTIEHPGYYRVEVDGDRTSFITRRGGQATVIPASGEPVVITPSEEVVVQGISNPQVTSYVAPQTDSWDTWNNARSDMQVDALSARYVSPGTYGVSDLDRYGTWRNVPTYGSVWIPTSVQSGWAPYTTGSWTLDPDYGWTWVDTAPWGWAPYHHGRWVNMNGFWGWAPGPVVARPVYAPALVAFFGGPNVSVGISIGVGWVALGWGEPIVPWWGRPGVAREPSWRGWGGPHVVNDVVINNTTVVNVTNINIYRNTTVRNAVVVVDEKRFGRGPITAARVTGVDPAKLRPTHAAPQIAATPASFVPGAGRGARPPDQTLKRPVVATRAPRAVPATAAGGERKIGPPGNPTPPPRLVSAAPRREPDAVSPRPTLGQSRAERRTPDRVQPPPPPKPPAGRPLPPQREPNVAASDPTAPRRQATPTVATPSPGRRPEKPEIATPSPSAPSSPATPATPSAPPSRRADKQAEKQQAAVPSPNVPQSPAAPATPPPPPNRRAEKQAEKQVEKQQPAALRAPATPPAPPARRAEKQAEKQQAAAPSPGPSPAAPATPPAPPARRAEKQAEKQQAAAPSPGAPAIPPPAPARRAEAATPPAKPLLPGEPANGLAPHRVEARQGQPGQR